MQGRIQMIDLGQTTTLLNDAPGLVYEPAARPIARPRVIQRPRTVQRSSANRAAHGQWPAKALITLMILGYLVIALLAHQSAQPKLDYSPQAGAGQLAVEDAQAMQGTYPAHHPELVPLMSRSTRLQGTTFLLTRTVTGPRCPVSLPFSGATQHITTTVSWNHGAFHMQAVTALPC
jgi:hypothetical protein